MFHLRPTLWNQVTLRSHRVSCKQCANHLWPDIEQKHSSRELLRNFFCSVGVWLAMWPSGKRTKGRSLLKTAEMSFFERRSSGTAWPQLACGCRHSPKQSLAGWQISHRVLLLLTVLSQGQKVVGWERGQLKTQEASERHYPLWNIVKFFSLLYVF